MITTGKYLFTGRTLMRAVCAAIAVFLASGTAPAQEKPLVTIVPDKGQVEAALTISGRGFQPGEEVDVVLILGEGLRIGLGTAKVEVITADQNGAFTAESHIPKMAKPAEYRIEVIGSKGSAASAILRVLPKE